MIIERIFILFTGEVYTHSHLCEFFYVEISFNEDRLKYYWQNENSTSCIICHVYYNVSKFHWIISIFQWIMAFFLCPSTWFNRGIHSSLLELGETSKPIKILMWHVSTSFEISLHCTICPSSHSSHVLVEGVHSNAQARTSWNARKDDDVHSIRLRFWWLV